MSQAEPGTLGELDRHLVAEGRHERLWEVLGARVCRDADGTVAGVAFVVWAPRADRVRVCGDFGPDVELAPVPDTGLWHGFAPRARPGHRYRLRVRTPHGDWVDKADPMAFRTAPPTDPTADPIIDSVIDEPRHRWHDDRWLRDRETHSWSGSQLSVYEVHLGSWRPGLDYRRAAEQLADYVAELGFTHVELLPITEHPFGGSWGYQVSSYFAPTARYGRPDDFRHLVDTLHRRGIGVLLDWVPAHFPKDRWALGRFDGTAAYEHPDPRRGEHPDWGTYVFDHGRAEVRNFLVANALYWIEEFHVDGLRVDAVASMLYLDYSRGPGQWVPNQYGGNENLEAMRFLQELTATVGKHHPSVLLVAEDSSTWPGVTARTEHGGLGFGLKWNLGWMHDTLTYLRHEPADRPAADQELRRPAGYAWQENFLLPLSHDEVVHGKGSLWTRMPGDDAARAATLRVLLAYQWAFPGKQLLFMGAEFGQRREWSHMDGLDWSLLADPLHAGIRRLVAALNRLQRLHPALYERDHEPAGFAWLADDPDRNLIAFERIAADGGAVVCVLNLADRPVDSYPLRPATPGTWRLVLDTARFGTPSRASIDQFAPTEVRLSLPPVTAVYLASDSCATA